VHFEPPEQQLQADLIWAATSPDMMDIAATSGVAENDLSSTASLRSISQSPANARLHNWLINNDHAYAMRAVLQQEPSHRLGIYYERLWRTILEHYPGFQLIAKNLPVKKDLRTLGEMDFVYYCRQRQRHVHLETAVKFYLGVPDGRTKQSLANTSSQWPQWLGPGCKDRLDIKLNRMIDKQTRLSTTEEGIRTLEKIDVFQPLREICLKGYFFYPLNEVMPPPPQSHQHHARGHWLPLQSMHLLEDQSVWHIMKKEQWLAPVSLDANSKLLNKKNLEVEVKSRLSSNPFPIMAANMQASNGHYLEQGRYFITPDNWPNCR